MKAINLGVEDGLPTVDWDSIAQEARGWSGPGSRRAQLPHDLAHDAQRGREPARDTGGRPLARRGVLVPDRLGHQEAPERRARPALHRLPLVRTPTSSSRAPPSG